MPATGTNDERAARKAWKALPREVRGSVIRAAVRGERPSTDPTTWPVVHDWASLYPGRSIANGLLGAWFFVTAVLLPDLYSPFRWLVVAWGGFVLSSVVVMNWVASRVRRHLGPRPAVPRGQPQP